MGLFAQLASPTLTGYDASDVPEALAGQIGSALTVAFGLAVVVIGALLAWRWMRRFSGV